MPARSLDQRHAALAEANRRRALRAQRKALWRRGPVAEARADLFDLMDSPPDWASTWRIVDVLMAQPKLGRVKVGGLLRRVGVSPGKTLGGLTERQRRELREVVPVYPEPGVRSPTCPECGGRKDRKSERCRGCRFPGSTRFSGRR